MRRDDDGVPNSMGSTGPYTVRVVRALRGGNRETRDAVTVSKYSAAHETAERVAADHYDDEDFTVIVLVLDRYGVPLHRARGDREEPVARNQVRRRA